MTRRWLERAAAPAWWPIERKAKKFVAAPRGPHSIADSMSLTVVVRDVLKLADTATEARHVIKAGKVMVDGRRVRDPKFGVGPMDILAVPELGKAWRAVPGARLRLVPTDGEDAGLKLCRINGKTTVRGGKCQVNLHDGRNLLTDRKLNTRDTLVLRIPEQEIVEHVKLEPGALVLVTRGVSTGALARLERIEPRRAWLNANNKVFEVPLAAVFAVGKERPVVKLTE